MVFAPLFRRRHNYSLRQIVMSASSDDNEVSSVFYADDSNTGGRSVAAIVAPNHAGNHVPPLSMWLVLLEKVMPLLQMHLL
jgi:hypothetical protein